MADINQSPDVSSARGVPPELICILIAYVLVAVPFISRSLTHDELITVQMFAELPTWQETVSNYPYPNNHFLHSLMVRWSGYLPIGDVAPRLPALLGGLAFLSVCFVWFRRQYGRFEAVCYTLLISAVVPVLAFAHHARGYSWLMAFSALSIVAFARYFIDGAGIRWLVIAWAAAVLSAYTVPTGLAMLGTGAVLQCGKWLWCIRRRKWRSDHLVYEAACGIFALAAILALYRPVLLRMLNQSAQDKIAYSLPSFMADLHYLTALPSLLALLLAVSGVVLMYRRSRDLLAAVPFAALLVPFVMMTLIGHSQFSRVLLGLTAPLWFFICENIHAVASRMQSPGRRRLAGVCLTAVCLAFLVPAIVRYTHASNQVAVGDYDEDWKEAVHFSSAHGGPELPVQFRAAAQASVVNSCASYYVHRGTVASEIAARNADLLPPIQDGISGELSWIDTVFHDIWRPASERVLLPFVVPQPFTIRSTPLKQFTVATVSKLTLTAPPIRATIDIPVMAARLRAEKLKNFKVTAVLEDGATVGVNIVCEQKETVIVLNMDVPKLDETAGIQAVAFTADIAWDPGMSMHVAGENFVRWSSATQFLECMSGRGGRSAARIQPGFGYPEGGERIIYQPIIVMSTGPSQVRVWGVAPYKDGPAMVGFNIYFGYTGRVTLSQVRVFYY